ncbi:hypothetical protein QNN00_10860 [Bacillus velezensis]|nr:hypothetical protein [Bacillus velezensis]
MTVLAGWSALEVPFSLTALVLPEFPLHPLHMKCLEAGQFPGCFIGLKQTASR